MRSRQKQRQKWLAHRQGNWCKYGKWLAKMAVGSYARAPLRPRPDSGSQEHTGYRHRGSCCCVLPTLDISIEFPVYLRARVGPSRVESSGSIKVSEVAATTLLLPLKCLTMQNKLHLRCSIMHIYSMSMILFALQPGQTKLVVSEGANMGRRPNKRPAKVK